MVSIEYPIEKLVELFKKQLEVNSDPVKALEQALSLLGREYLLQADKVVVTGLPLGSMTASGKFQDKVFATRNGKTHLRKLVIPHDPKTAQQRSNRTRFADIVQSWKALPQSVKDEYNQKTKGTPKTGLNLYIEEQSGK